MSTIKKPLTAAERSAIAFPPAASPRGEGAATPLPRGLFQSEGSWAVWAVEQGRDGLEAEVSGGLSEGERVIVHPSDAIGDGVRVRLRGG